MDRDLDQASYEVPLAGIEPAKVVLDVGALSSFLLGKLPDVVWQLGADVSQRFVVVLAADRTSEAGRRQAAAVLSPRSGRYCRQPTGIFGEARRM